MVDEDLELGLEDASALLHATERARLEESLFAFVQEFWKVVEPSRDLIVTWHIEAICGVLERVTDGDLERAIFNIPPGTLKSLLVNVFWPAWMWAKNPKKRVLSGSYGQHLSMRDNLRTRSLVESPEYQRYWPIRLDEDQNTKNRMNTVDGGWRIATSVGGVGTGEHPHIIIIDDPHTAQQAMSDAERQMAIDWFDRTLSSRGATSGVRIVVVMQRLHEDDLTGHLLQKGGWEHVRFPMRYVPTRPPSDDDRGYIADPRDPRRENGELLCPALLPEPKVRQLELDLGPYGAAGQLQQQPAPEGGGLFKREWFKFVDVAPKIKRVVRGWDTASTEENSQGKGDYTAGVKISEEFDYVLEPIGDSGRTRRVLKSTGRFFVEDVVRGKWGPSDVDTIMRETAEQDGREVSVREEKEPGGAGKAIVAARSKLLKGYDYTFTALGSNKVTRAKPFRAQCEAGNVYLVRGKWNEEYIHELTGFPTGKHDDQVDGSSCAFNAVLMEPPPRKAKATW